MGADQQSPQPGVKIEGWIGFGWAVRRLGRLLCRVRREVGWATEAGIGIYQGAKPDDSACQAAQQQGAAFVQSSLRSVSVGLISVAVGTCDHQWGSQGRKKVIGFTVNALPLELDACCGGQVAMAADTDMSDNLRVSADPRARICWALHVGIVVPRRRMRSPQDCRIQAILLGWTDAQASRGQVNLEEECHVGARDEHHRAHE